MQVICNSTRDHEKTTGKCKPASMHLRTLTALIGILLGIAVSEISVYGSEIAVVGFLIGTLQLLLYLYEVYGSQKKIVVGENEKEDRSSFSFSLLTSVLFFSLACAILRVQMSEEKNVFACSSVCTFSGTIVSSPKMQDVYQIFSIHPTDSGHTYDVQVKTALYPRYHKGEEVTLTSKVSLPVVTMPHGDARVFDYAMYLRLHGIGSEMLYPKIAEVNSSHESNFMLSLEQLRESLVTRISAHMSNPASLLATGMLFGVSSMSQELLQTFRTAGLSHIIVLSGFNIAILISFVLLVFKFLPLMARIFFAGILSVIFVLMVGGEASIVRATLMAFVGLLALGLGRAYVARQALLLSLIAIIMYEPIHALHDVSLHLSFLATAGIIYMSEKIKSNLEDTFVRVTSKSLQEMLATTLAAYFATLPYILYTFGTASVYALIANILVLPLVPVVMLLTFIVVLLSVVPSFAHVVGYADSLLANYIIFVGRAIERLPFSSITVSISLTTMFVVYVVLIMLFVILTRKVKNETLLTKENEIISEVISY